MSTSARRPARLLVALLSLALLAIPFLATSSADAAGSKFGHNARATSFPTRVIFHLSTTRAVYGSTRTAAAQVQGYTEGAWYSIPSESSGHLVLQRRVAGSSTWVNLGSRGVPNATYAVKALRHAAYRAFYTGGTYNGTAVFPAKVSGQLAQSISRNLAERAAKSHGKLFLKGNVNPGWAKKKVTIQRKTCAKCAFHTYSKVRTTKYGVWKARVKPPRRGYWYYRAFIPRSSGYVASIGATYAAYRY